MQQLTKNVRRKRKEFFFRNKCILFYLVLKTGTSGLVCYRIQTKDSRWQWLQSSMRIIYKSNKPDFVIANHRPLT